MQQKIANYLKDNYQHLMSIAICRVENAQDADDVLQEATLTLIRQVASGRLTREEDIPRYFTTCIGSRAIDLDRKEAKYGIEDGDLESGLVMAQQFDPTPNPEEILVREQEVEALEGYIKSIPGDTARAINRHHYDYEYSQSETARVLNVSKQYVSTVLKR